MPHCLRSRKMRWNWREKHFDAHGDWLSGQESARFCAFFNHLLVPESGDDGELKEHVGIVVLNEKKSRFLFRKKYMEYIVLSVKWV